jgi:uncharacterized membrane protein YhfC
MNPLFYTYLLAGLVMVGLPLVLGFFLDRHYHVGWRLWAIGAAGFILSQVGHIPFNSLLTWLFQKGILPAPPLAWGPFFNPIVLGLSAGLWEEMTRYAIFRWWAKDARSWRKGLMLGVGHGGVEAIILGSLVLYTLLQMVQLLNADISKLIPPAQLAQAQAQVQAYWSASWPMTLLGAVERVFAVTSHIALAILVLQAFTRRKFYWVWIAVLFHAAMDTAAVYFSQAWAGHTWTPFAVEGVVGVFALLGLAIILLLRQPEPSPAEEPAVLAPIPPQTIQEIKETSESLDNTRYL